MEEENSRLVAVGFFLWFAAELGEAHPHISCHSFQVGEVDRGFVFAREELDRLLVGQLFVLGLQSQVAEKHIILEGLSELANRIGSFLDEHLQAFELEVSDFFDGGDVELVDECGDEVSAIGVVPVI